jgi:hypothetical protein
MVRVPSIGRGMLRVSIGALCVAAAAASYGLLSGEFSDTDWKVVATSTLFALVSSMAAAGIAVRPEWAVLGAATVAAAAATFVLVTVGMWAELDGEGFWRATASIAVVSIELAHVSFVRSRLRRGDPPSVVLVTRVAIALALVSGLMGVAPLAGIIDDGGDVGPYWELLGVVLIGQLLCTALAPLLRRLHVGAERPAVAVPTPGERLAQELVAVAERLERLDAGPQVRAECERLRRLARATASH